MRDIGNVIKEYRLKSKKTQEELGKELFVTKQAVSKWESGKTLPDINTIKKLVAILSIPQDEILGEAITQTKRSRTVTRILIPIITLSILLSIFFAFDGIGAIQRRLQSGVCILTVNEDGVFKSSDDYRIIGVNDVKLGTNGYSFGIGYGEVKGTIVTSENKEIEFGFVNTNEWHNVQIIISINKNIENAVVRQCVIYKTDNDKVEVLDTKAHFDGNKASVFRDGV